MLIGVFGCVRMNDDCLGSVLIPIDAAMKAAAKASGRADALLTAVKDKWHALEPLQMLGKKMVPLDVSSYGSSAGLGELRVTIKYVPEVSKKEKVKEGLIKATHSVAQQDDAETEKAIQRSKWCGHSTTWTILEQDGPNQLGL